MDKLKRFLSEPGVHLLVIVIYLFVFGWPFLFIPKTGSQAETFTGLFASWLVFILILYMLRRI